ncbi:YeiH family protein [Microbacterium ulmi]|uniref:Putative sulfate exporter family transporter n=1 Tax=Microbacterium ulmi TaxID=179095 RepID=A0A7Y2M2I9_9MICO|nr:putative sulfate exporter family transporter [Microbacterium ulmi]NII70401.1 putative integral membrane protein (TIGR00698 family) [Microbacterium ulmi]NNH04997.1 putative sulfate exporter family transporter [Microbacterium ulmi]
MAENKTPGTASDLAEATDTAPAAPRRVTPDELQIPDAAAATAKPGWGWTTAGLVAVFVVGVLTWLLSKNVPIWTAGTPLESIGAALEFPVYAIALGLLGNVVLYQFGVRDRIAAGFRTELFIKVGLVLLGASVDLGVIAKNIGPAIIQAILLISGVFFFTWWVAGKLGVEEKTRALLSSAVSICGVSAAIAAAGAVQAKREQLGYVASLVVLFALPSIFLLPWLAGLLGLSPAVTGAWIGGNIDTTAAVTAAGSLAGEEALQIATIVKTTQNALIGIVAVLLTLYFTIKVPDAGVTERPRVGDIWHRFPKFVLGFILASVVATIYIAAVGDADATKPVIATINNVRTWAFIFGFSSIGLGFSVAAVKRAGARPVLAFFLATIVNIVLALALAFVLFGWLFAA